jgi:putative transposase
MARRARVEPTEDWGQLKLLLKFPEQLEYERIRPPVLFGASVAERSRQTETPESTLHRRISGFEKDGMRSLFETERIESRAGASLDPEIRRLILDLGSEYPPMRNNEIATICHVRFGHRPHGRTVERILRENPASIRMFRRFDPYHEIPDAADRRLAIVALHSEGWNVKSIAGYLKTYRSTVYRTLKKMDHRGRPRP